MTGSDVLIDDESPAATEKAAAPCFAWPRALMDVHTFLSGWVVSFPHSQTLASTA